MVVVPDELLALVVVVPVVVEPPPAPAVSGEAPQAATRVTRVMKKQSRMRTKRLERRRRIMVCSGRKWNESIGGEEGLDDGGALLWVDDAMWGPEALDFTRVLLAGRGGPRVLVVLTVRDDVVAERPAEADALVPAARTVTKAARDFLVAFDPETHLPAAARERFAREAKAMASMPMGWSARSLLGCSSLAVARPGSASSCGMRRPYRGIPDRTSRN